MAWNTGTIALAAHCPPNMPLLPELGWLLGVSVAINMPLLRSCFAQVLFHRKRRGTKSCQEAATQAALKRPPCRSPIARKTLQPFARWRSNSPMEAGDLAKAARPRPAWAKLMNQESIVPGLGSNMNLVEKVSCC